MKEHIFNLQLFDDGGEGGSGDQNTNAGNGNGGQNSGGFSFAQAEEIANARASRAEKAALSNYFKQQGMNESEITQAIAEYKRNKESQKPDISAIERERDAAKAELEAYKNQTTLQTKGVKAEDLDYVQFKISALMEQDKNLDFVKAADKFLKENPRFSATGGYKVATGTSNSNSQSSSANATINDAIRRAAGRK